MFREKLAPKLGGFLSVCCLLSVLLSSCGATTATPPPSLPTATAQSTTSVAITAPATTAATTTPVATTAPATTAPVLVTPTPVAISGPNQPEKGFGGKEYTYNEITSKRYGENAETYYIFEPKDATDKSLPVVVLMHGYTGIDPYIGYLPWITHLVKRGNIVIFPTYQLLNDRDGTKFTDNALTSLKAAFQELQNGKHAKPELDKVVAVGYSAGGVIATNYTIRAAAKGLPVPKALFAVTPGGCANCSNFSIANFMLAAPEELKSLPADLKMVVLVGDQDRVVGLTAGDLIWKNSGQIPAANRSYVQVISDAHGLPELIGDHSMAVNLPPNAHNYYGIWKIQDALQSCALTSKGCEYALGGTSQQLDLGKWSDGTPIKPLKVLG